MGEQEAAAKSLKVQEYSLNNLSRINVVLGKNGCGKSRMLRQLDSGLAAPNIAKYITPERGGSVIYEPGIESAINSDVNWMRNSRSSNLFDNFRQQSVAQYRKLETLALRDLENKAGKGFQPYIEKLNQLLDRIELVREREVMSFVMREKGSEKPVRASDISSGESELISLGIEFLVFSEELKAGSDNWLLIDEPDVHLHPDLQVRLIRFLEKLVGEKDFNVILATHSTAILGAFEDYSKVRLAFMTPGQKSLSFIQVSESHRKLLPVFGAHPLTNIFNEAPFLLVEGESDVRIWQEAKKSAGGSIVVYPCPAGSVDKLKELESDAREILKAVYDDAKGYSLIDGDGITESIEDILPITRMRLNCRTAENLLLSDDALGVVETNWSKLQVGIEKWLEDNKDHCNYGVMQEFKKGGYDRRQASVKEIRNDIIGIIGTSKPWEVVVGRAISKLASDPESPAYDSNTVADFLGEKVVSNLVRNITM